MKSTLQLNPERIKKICIVGNLNIDLIIRNIPNFPAWGQEVLGKGYSIVSSGQSAYSAFALRKLNVPVSIVGNVGDDIYGKMILNDLDRAGVITEAVETSKNKKTGITIAIVRPDGERAFVSDTAGLSEFTLDLVLKYQPQMTGAEIVCFVGSFFVPGLPISDTVKLLQKTKSLGKPTFLDTGWDPANWPKETVSTLRKGLQYVDYFIPNMDEARAITGQNDPENALKALLSDGAKTVVIKMGSQGSLANAGADVVHVPVLPVEVIDAVGAGDVFNAGFLFGTLQGWPVEARMYFGSALSALYISKSEDRFPVLDDLLQVLNKWSVSPYAFKAA